MAQDLKRIERGLHVAVEKAKASALSYSSVEAQKARAVRDSIRMVATSSSVSSIFESIGSLIPFAAGSIEVTPVAQPERNADYLYNVPENFLLEVAQNIEKDPAPFMLTRCKTRVALRGSDIFPDGEFYRMEYSQQVYGRFGIDCVTGMILTRDEELALVLWLFSGSGARLPSWNECRVLELLCNDIRDAVMRARLPLAAHQSILFQIMQEQDDGYVLLRPNGTMVEVNRKGTLLARKYAPPGVTSWQKNIYALISTAPTGVPRGIPGKYQVSSHDGLNVLKLQVYRLPKERHAISEDLIMIRMIETTRDIFARLSPRQRQVAVLLADSGLSYKEIADRLGIAYGTMCKFAERTYRNLNVHSRLELIALAANGNNEKPTA